MSMMRKNRRYFTEAGKRYNKINDEMSDACSPLVMLSTLEYLILATYQTKHSSGPIKSVLMVVQGVLRYI